VIHGDVDRMITPAAGALPLSNPGARYMESIPGMARQLPPKPSICSSPHCSPPLGMTNPCRPVTEDRDGNG